MSNPRFLLAVLDTAIGGCSFHAELFASAVLPGRPDCTDFLANQLRPAIAERDTPDAFALILALGAVADGTIAVAVTAGLDRRDHELASGVGEADDDERWPYHHALALLLRTWLESVPETDRPRTPHATCARPAGAPLPLQRRKVPAARNDADGPAPVFQHSVSLTGSTPPIWRRIELPADIKLNELHGVIQVAFEWDDYHTPRLSLTMLSAQP